MNTVIAACLSLIGGVVLPRWDTGTIPLNDPQSISNHQVRATSSAQASTKGNGTVVTDGTPATALPRTFASPEATTPPRSSSQGLSNRTPQPQTTLPVGTGQRLARRQTTMQAQATTPMSEPYTVMMPIAPTDPAVGVYPSVPATPLAYGATGLGTTGTAFRPAFAPPTPTYPPLAQSQTLADRTLVGRPQVYSYYPPARGGERPFANYQFQPAISPYQNLYRPTTTGTDNYYTLVRPQVQQQATNQLFSGDLGGLFNSVQRQGSAIRQLNQDTQVMQGLVNPQYFINYQQYYPTGP
jgi:hypothetical protein